MAILETAGIVLLTWTLISLVAAVLWSRFMGQLHRQQDTLALVAVRQLSRRPGAGLRPGRLLYRQF